MHENLWNSELRSKKYCKFLQISWQLLPNSWKFDDQAHWSKIAIWAMSWSFELKFKENWVAQSQFKKNSIASWRNSKK